jgi:hypothetical protein
MLAQSMLGETALDGGALDEVTLGEIRSARARLGEVLRALSSSSAPHVVTPEEIGGCAPLLEEAIACLRAMPAPQNPSLRNGPELAREFEGLRFELGVVRRLIEGGAEFYRGWARILATAAAGYTPSGEPAALTASGSVSLEG